MDFLSGKCGVVLPLWALESAYGIGSMGEEARRFVDFLAGARQRCWQLLPLYPAGKGDSPYHPLSVFAGWSVYIDLDDLVSRGLLAGDEVAAARVGYAPAVDYEAVRESRERLLRLAFSRSGAPDGDRQRFYEENRDWLDNWAAFMSDQPGAQSNEAQYQIFVQYLFFDQWTKLRAYAQEKGVALMGDLPIYCSPDGAEFQKQPELFQTDEAGRARAVAGVPPDYFSETGQLWGNPLYDWERMRLDGWAFWKRRLAAAMGLYDLVRLDHFRGFERYWSIPAGAKTAGEGSWEPGPGLAFFREMKRALPGLRLVAEDLGLLTQEVHDLRIAAGLPRMKVLQFAFDEEGSDYLPENCGPDCICYTGTHDNDTLAGWIAKASDGQLARVRAVVEDGEPLDRALIRSGLCSRAWLFMAQMQDYLGLGSAFRTNTPGTVGGNWGWRMPPGVLTDDLACKMADMAVECGRG